MLYPLSYEGGRRPGDVTNAVPNVVPNPERTAHPSLTILWAVRPALEAPIAA